MIDNDFLSIRIETPLGTLIAGVIPDSEYPGIAIELEEKETGIRHSVSHTEYDPVKAALVSRIWSDAKQEECTVCEEHAGFKKEEKYENDSDH